MKIVSRLKNIRGWLPAGAAMIALTLSACDSGNNSSQVERVEVALPISLNEVMVGLINKVADPQWAAVWNDPQSERDWRELENLAYQVELGGTLLQYPGIGLQDREWTSSQDWQALAKQLSQDGARAVNAVRSRNRDLMDRAGGQLIETCEACHRTFKPDLPMMDQFGQQQVRPRVSL